MFSFLKIYVLIYYFFIIIWVDHPFHTSKSNHQNGYNTQINIKNNQKTRITKYVHQLPKYFSAQTNLQVHQITLFLNLIL